MKKIITALLLSIGLMSVACINATELTDLITQGQYMSVDSSGRVGFYQFDEEGNEIGFSSFAKMIDEMLARDPKLLNTPGANGKTPLQLSFEYIMSDMEGLDEAQQLEMKKAAMAIYKELKSRGAQLGTDLSSEEKALMETIIASVARTLR